MPMWILKITVYIILNGPSGKVLKEVKSLIVIVFISHYWTNLIQIVLPTTRPLFFILKIVANTKEKFQKLQKTVGQARMPAVDLKFILKFCFFVHLQLMLYCIFFMLVCRFDLITLVLIFILFILIMNLKLLLPSKKLYKCFNINKCYQIHLVFIRSDLNLQQECVRFIISWLLIHN